MVEIDGPGGNWWKNKPEVKLGTPATRASLRKQAPVLFEQRMFMVDILNFFQYGGGKEEEETKAKRFNVRFETTIRFYRESFKWTKVLLHSCSSRKKAISGGIFACWWWSVYEMGKKYSCTIKPHETLS